MKFCAERMKIVVEPTGCLALAGVKYGGIDLKGKRVGVIISGGNMDMGKYSEFLKSWVLRE